MALAPNRPKVWEETISVHCAYTAENIKPYLNFTDASKRSLA